MGNTVVLVLIFLLSFETLPTTMASALKVIATYRLANNMKLKLAFGSVLDFASKKGAIVNAANEGCLGGGGVDGAISAAGGEALARDREKLPVIQKRRLGNIGIRDESDSDDSSSGSDSEGGFVLKIRCPTGSAVMTGPGDYEDLNVNYVIHAVGPDYHDFNKNDPDDLKKANDLLQSAYSSSLDLAVEHGLEEVAFSLLSSGVFRGSQKMEHVLGLGITSILNWSENRIEGASLSDVFMCAFVTKEWEAIQKVCDEHLEKDIKEPVEEQD